MKGESIDTKNTYSGASTGSLPILHRSLNLEWTGPDRRMACTAAAFVDKCTGICLWSVLSRHPEVRGYADHPCLAGGGEGRRRQGRPQVLGITGKRLGATPPS